jgi:hypothetical protein
MADQSDKTPPSPLLPPKEMTIEELIAWHKQNGTLRQFLKDHDCGRER